MAESTAGLTRDDHEPGVPFRDGLGERHLAVDPDTGDTLERFLVNAELATQERALRERVDRLLNFRNVRFPRLHHLDVEASGQVKAVTIVSEHVPGVRLSDLMTFVGAHPTLVVDVNAALQVAREVLPALAVLHDSRGVTHGALGLERLILTPHARVAIADYALGAALTKLSLPRTRLWRDYRIAMPPSAGVPRFDARADVASVALAVLALMLGRPLASNEFPNGLRGLLDTAVERLPNGTVRPLSSSLRGWFDRALPTESRRPFGAAGEAQLALEEVLKKERAYAPAASALKSFLQRYTAARPDASALNRPGGRTAPAPAGAAVIDFKPGASAVAPSESAHRSQGPASRNSGPARASTRSRTSARRLTPEEEEADEIRALEAELARLAKAEAAATKGEPVASPAAEAAPPPVEPAAATVGTDVPRLRVVAPVDEVSPIPAIEMVPPAVETAQDETSPIESLVAPVAPVTASAPLAPDVVASETIEVEILTHGQELPVLDVASLSDDTTSTVFASPTHDLVTPLLPSTTPADTEEIADLERLLQRLRTEETAASEPAGAVATVPDGVAGSGETTVIDAGELCEVPRSAVEETCEQVPGWVLTAPSLETGTTPGCAAAEDDQEAAPRCDHTLPLDFETPVYIQDLVARGAVTERLEALPGAIASDDVTRLQMFVASAAPVPAEASSPVKRTRSRRAREGVSHVRALPERSSAATGALSVRRPARLEAFARVSAEGQPAVAPLTLVPPSRARTRRQPLAALPAKAMPVDAGLAVRPQRVIDAIAAATEAVALLRLVPATPRSQDEPVPALVERTPAAIDALEASASVADVPDLVAAGAVADSDGVAREPAWLESGERASLADVAPIAGAPVGGPHDEPVLLADGTASDLTAPEAVSELDQLLDVLEATAREEEAALAWPPDAAVSAGSGLVADGGIGGTEASPHAHRRDVDGRDVQRQRLEDPPLGVPRGRVEEGPFGAGSDRIEGAVPATGIDALEPPLLLEAPDITLDVRAEDTTSAIAPKVDADAPDAAMSLALRAEPPRTEPAAAEAVSWTFVETPAESIDLGALAEELAREVEPDPVVVQEPPIAEAVPRAEPAVPAEAAGPADRAAPVEPLPASRKTKTRRSRAKTRRPEPPAVVPFVPQAPLPAEPKPIAYEPWRVPAAAQAEVPASRPSRPVPVRPADPWNTEAEAAKESQVVPFTPKPIDSFPDPIPEAVEAGGERPVLAPEPVAATTAGDSLPRAMFDWQSHDDEAPQPRRPAAPRDGRRWRIDWKRTAAASLAVMLLEGVAFATAYWFVKPQELGTLLVDTSQSGIEVLIDGRKSGVTPLSVQLKPGRYTLEMRGYGATKVLPVEISPGVQTTQSLKWPRGARLGTLNVKTTPDGARILVDGVYRGTAPLSLDDVPAGTHTVVAESPSGVVTSQVQVSDRAPTDLDVGIFSGFLTVYAPVEVRVFDGSKLLGTSLDGKMLVSAGPHTLELVNKRLGYRETRSVLIEPGKESVLSIEAPNGTIVIEAPDGTEVVVDGQPAGVMPIEKVTAPIGTREVILRHPAIGQRRMTVTVGADIPVRVSLLAPQ